MAKPETRNKAKRDSTTKAFFIPHIILGFSWDGGKYPGLLPGGTFPFCATVRYTFPRLFQRRLHILKTVSSDKWRRIDEEMRRPGEAHRSSQRLVLSSPTVVLTAIQTVLHITAGSHLFQKLRQLPRLRLVVLYRVVD